MTRISNLGRVLTILARQEAEEAFRHADVDIWYAPSECHALVARGEKDRKRQAFRHARAEARLSRKALRRVLHQSGYGPGTMNFAKLVDRYYSNHFPF